MGLNEEIKKLKDELKIKEKILFYIKEGNEKYKKLLKDNFEIWSYFRKFRDPSHIEQQFLLGSQDKIIFSNYPGWFNQIKEDLDQLKKEISKKEYLLQQRLFLGKQEEFLEIQKQDMNENKKYREKINNFTLILALSALAAVIYYIAQIGIQFKTSSTLHTLFFSGISMLGLVLLLLFIIESFKIKENLLAIWKKRWFWILIVVILMVILSWFMLTIPDAPTTMNTQNKLTQEIQNTNTLFNQSINNQKEMNNRLDTIILNYINDTPK